MSNYENIILKQCFLFFYLLATPSSSEDNKWACPLCTYFNWPKALRCTQCLTPRRSRVSPSTTAMQRGTPKSSNEGMATTQVAPSPPSLESLRISTPSPPSKWNCSICTYENWPRTRKCVLCGAIKEATPTRDEVSITPASPLASGASSSRLSEQERNVGKFSYDPMKEFTGVNISSCCLQSMVKKA